MISLKKTVLLLLVFACKYVAGQDPYYYTIDKSKGLPSNSVYDIYQDKKGFMWFATDDGLNRYDGAKYSSYYSDGQTSRAGSKIEEDKYGRIWYSNFDGYLYYVQQGKLHKLNQAKPIGFFSYAITANFLFVLKKGAVSIYHLKTLKLYKNVEISEATIVSSCKMGNAFYVLANALYEVTADSGVKKIMLPQNFYPSLKQAIMMKATPKGLLFVSKITNSYYWYGDGHFLQKSRPNDLGYAQNLTFIDHGIWLFSPKGASILSTQSNKVSHYFKQHNISYAYKDNRGNYWFSTLNKGLILVPNFGNSLVEMASRPVRLALNKNKLIVATEDEALYQMNLDDLTTHLVHKGNSNHSINQLFVDTTSGKVMFSSNTFNILSASYQKLVKAHVAIKDVEKIDHKYYSFAASGFSGLFKITPSQQKSEWDSVFNSYNIRKSNFNEVGVLIGVNGKSTVYHTVNKTIYYATNIGLFYVNKSAQGELKFNGETLFIKNLVCLGKKVFALSANGKLYEIEVTNQVKVSNLIKANAIRNIYRITSTNSLMFIYATSGIYCFDTATNNLRQLPNSYQDFEITDIVEHDSNYIIATSKGVLVEPNKAPSKAVRPTFIVDDLLVNEVKVEPNMLSDLAHNQNNITINYALLAYTPLEKLPVYYQLNGGKWQRLDEQSGSLKLSAISPGQYQIQFKLGENQILTKVAFNIEKPFWLSVWFITLIALVVSTLVYLLYRYKIEQNNKRNQQKLDRVSLENNLNQSKLKAIKSQMNPHFFYNALNTIQSYILANEKKNAVNYLSKFANLTRTILEMTEKEEISLAEEIKTIRLYLDIEKARFDSDFNYSITMLGINAGEDIKIPSMLLQPYLENAIKHGLLHKEGNKQLEVTFKKEASQLVVTIADNGIGRKKSTELNQIKQLKHKSFATAAIQSRIELLNKDKRNKISVSYEDKLAANQQGVGTVVIIKMPLNEE
ncbi:MAG: histidine kinase [Pedobacter sp.]|uniref:sensor histidine kinase n=1 Tax=Pedobacter sp. TaxID=1411316 RepID=UPI0028093649|nr:histidine kinase [Pedobacter sp.]MDQ8005740.1 histidine kinase [Pedobacter sp.]